MAISVSDNQDGSGLNVTVSGLDPAAAVTIQVNDTAFLDTWRDTSTLTGNGTVLVPADGSAAGITLTRTYWVRASIVLASVETFSQSYLRTATQGFKSDIFAIILAAKHRIIRDNITRVGGKVFHCIDPNGAVEVVGELPALFVNQSEAELPTPMDNRTSGFVFPIRVTLGMTDDKDWISGLQYWLYVRQRLWELFDRQQIDHVATNETNVRTYGGRRWKVRFDPVTPDRPQDYKYRGTGITLLVDGERLIGGN